MRSMTGFIKKIFRIEDIIFNIEIKSYNSKYPEHSIKLPVFLDHLEMAVKKCISEFITRGKVYLTISVEEGGEKDISLDPDKLKKAVLILNQIKSSINYEREISISDVLKLKFIFRESYQLLDEKILAERFWPELQEALQMFNASRQKEAESLYDGICGRIENIRESVRRIEELDRDSEYQIRKKISDKIEELCRENNYSDRIDGERLEQEVLYYILKYDIKEELERLKSHIKTILEHINLDKPVGKAITFLLQEVLRETNTICSKTSDINIKNEAISIKIETERIREQVNNIE